MSKKRKKDQRADDDDASTSGSTKAKRPDRAKHLAIRRTLIETCHKTSLGTRLGPEWEKAHRDVLVEMLKRQVRSVSEITVRGSFVVNSVISAYLKTQCSPPSLDQSFFNKCFLEGLERQSTRRSKSNFSLVEDVVENEFYDYPQVARCRGDIQVVTIAAKRYMTNFKTAVTSKFIDRQRAFITTWLKIHEVDDDVNAYEIQCRINGWTKQGRPNKRKKADTQSDDFL